MDAWRYRCISRLGTLVVMVLVTNVRLLEQQQCMSSAFAIRVMQLVNGRLGLAPRASGPAQRAHPYRGVSLVRRPLNMPRPRPPAFRPPPPRLMGWDRWNALVGSEQPDDEPALRLERKSLAPGTWRGYDMTIRQLIALGVAQVPIESVEELEALVVCLENTQRWRLDRMRSALNCLHTVFRLPPPPFSDLARLVKGVKRACPLSGDGSRLVETEELWEYAAYWYRLARAGSLCAARNVAAMFLQYFGGKRCFEMRFAMHDHFTPLTNGGLKWVIPSQKGQDKERVSLLQRATDKGALVAPLVEALMAIVPRDGGFLIRATVVAEDGSRVWGKGSEPWCLNNWNREVSLATAAVNQARAARVPPLAPWSHVTSHGFRKGTMTSLIRSDVHQSVASKRVLHHQGDSSCVPYCYDDPNSLQHVVKGLYSSGHGPASAAVAASLRHPVG